MTEQAPESRTVPVGLKVTPTEKKLLELVLREYPEIDGASNLLRHRSLVDVLQEGRAIEERMLSEGADRLTA